MGAWKNSRRPGGTRKYRHSSITRVIETWRKAKFAFGFFARKMRQEARFSRSYYLITEMEKWICQTKFAVLRN